MVQLDQLGSLDNPKLAPKFSRHFTSDLFLATMSTSYEKFMKNVKILQKEISDIKWELANSVLSTEERVEKKILLQRLEYQVGVLMQDQPGLK